MPDLSVTYMGLQLRNPIIAGASSLTSNMDRLKQLEDAGVGAVVIASLFEEQIQMESFRLEEDLRRHNEMNAEMITLFPEVKHAGAAEHLMWVRKAKEALSVPVIASLNAVTRETWVHYARELASTGVDGLELNLYATPTDPQRSSADIEAEEMAILQEVLGSVTVPVSVKLSFFYTNPLHVAHRMDALGVKGLVLFNRFFHPDFDIESESNLFPHTLSTSADSRIPLRYTGLLAGRIKADICANSGILTAADAVKLLLAGASAVQVASTLFKNGVGFVGTLVKEIEAWMTRRGYGRIEDFRGRMSAERNRDPWVYRRAQYVRLLLRADVLRAGPTG